MITVIFSSYNGESTLDRMLTACCDLVSPDGGWKLVAVDNASTDRTREIMQSYERRLPLTIVHVEQRGKNWALNAAIDHVAGDLVVFTDDDVIPDKNWLCSLCESAHMHPEHDLFGGPILPHWPHPPEQWLLTDVPLGVTFALTDPALSDGPISSDLIWGPNMAIRRSMLDQGMRFNTDVGPDGTGTYMMGSEMEFTRRLARNGAKSWFCASAKVQHMIRPHQLSAEWILQRAVRHGRSAYFFDHPWPPAAPTVFGMERWILFQLMASRLKALRYHLQGRQSDSFKAMRLHCYTKGLLIQARSMQANTHGLT